MTERLNFLKSRRSRLLIALTGLLAGMFVVTVAADRRPIGERAATWAASHADALPQTLEELAAYPAEYRRETLRVLPAERKSGLWRTQLRQFAADRPALSTEQRAFIDYAIGAASPESFQPGANPPALCDRIAALFPDVNDRRSLTKLASTATPTLAWRPTLVKFGERVRQSMVASADLPECSCRGSGVCDCPFLDVCGNDRCAPVEDCGCIFVVECDKLCVFILNRPIKK